MDIFAGREAAPMLIAQQMQAFDHPDWIYELKLDGFRCLAYVENGRVDFRNKRNVRMLPRFPELREIGENIGKRCILDGEIVVMTKGVPDFYRLQRRTLLTDRFKIETEALRCPAAYVVFDCLFAGDRELLWDPLMDRKDILHQLIREDEKIAVSRYIEKNGIALYSAAEERKLEGVVAKKKDSIYRMGRRTTDWVKFKRMADEDFIVAGYIKKGTHNFSIVLAKYKNDMLLFKGYVSAGVTRESIEALTVTGRNPFVLMPIGDSDVVWVKPDHVCIIEYMPNLNNSLRQPVFKGYRDDVLAEEIRILS